MEAEPVQVALSKFRAAQRPMSETTHGTEPRNPPFSRECFAERLKGKFGELRGERKPWLSFPACPRRRAATLPAAEGGGNFTVC